MPHGEGEDGQKHQQDTAKTDKSANKSGRISGQASAHAVCKHAQPGCSHMLDAGIGPSMDAVIFADRATRLESASLRLVKTR
jgi:hypothetical protein